MALRRGAALLVTVAVVAFFLLGARPETLESRAGSAKPAARLECGHPRRLWLQHFEDGSAKLWCAWRLLARVSVPW